MWGARVTGRMSEDDLAEVWARSLADLAGMQIEPHQRAWLQLTRPLGLVENTALIAAPNEFVKEQLETRLRALITNALSRELARSIQIAVTVDPAATADLGQPAEHLPGEGTGLFPGPTGPPGLTGRPSLNGLTGPQPGSIGAFGDTQFDDGHFGSTGRDQPGPPRADAGPRAGLAPFPPKTEASDTVRYQATSAMSWASSRPPCLPTGSARIADRPTTLACTARRQFRWPGRKHQGRGRPG